MGDVLSSMLAGDGTRLAPSLPRPPVPPADRADEEVLDLLDVPIPGGRFVRRIVSLLSALILLGAFSAAVILVFLHAHSSVSGDGFIRPAATWPVRSAEAGLIAEVLIHTGDSVQPSEPLVRLDTLQLATKLAQLREQYDEKYRAYAVARSARPITHERQLSRAVEARAHLQVARAALRTEMSQYEFFGDVDSLLWNHRLGTHVGLDRAVAEVIAAQAALHTAETEVALDAIDSVGLDGHAAVLRHLEAQVRIAEAQQARLIVRAPVHGVVQTDHLEQLRGAFVQQGDLLLEIRETGGWHADLFVSEQDVHEVHVGDSAAVLVRAFQGTQADVLHGFVTSVAATPRDSTTWSQGEQYRVTVGLSEGDVSRVGPERLRQGYGARGNVITGRGRIIELIWRYARKRL